MRFFSSKPNQTLSAHKYLGTFLMERFFIIPGVHAARKKLLSSLEIQSSRLPQSRRVRRAFHKKTAFILQAFLCVLRASAVKSWLI
jgi:hypothetical protein